jgi:GH15 family glucan-1,4-alpha-glucosidase
MMNTKGKIETANSGIALHLIRQIAEFLPSMGVLFAFLVLSLFGSVSLAHEQSFFMMPTGNGHGFQLFDSSHGRMVAFLDHPYRYLRPSKDETKDGIERRNLLESLSIGVQLPVQGRKLSNRFYFENELSPLSLAKADFLDETNIIRVRENLPKPVGSVGGSDLVSVEKYFFSPYGLEENALIAVTHLTDPMLVKGARGRAALRFHLGANPVSLVFWQPSLEVIKIPGEKVYRLDQFERPVWVLEGHGLGAIIYVPLQRATGAFCDLFGLHQGRSQEDSRNQLGDRSCVADELGLNLEAPFDGDGNFALMVAYVEDVSLLEQKIATILSWIGGRSSQELLNAARVDWRVWRKNPAIAFRSEDEAKLWRQNEAVLRMSQVREPNSDQFGSHRHGHGMILASLAPGHWTTAWVRDGTYSTVALSRTGHFEEARNSLNFFLNAEPVGKYKSFVDGIDYQISLTRYYGNGEEEADYSGQVTPNIETDGWGLVLWASRQYLDASNDWSWLNKPTRRGTVYQMMLEHVANPVLQQLETAGALADIMKPDSSIWEVHQQNARHFAYTTLAAARGLCDFASIARRSGHQADYEKFKLAAERVREAFAKAFRVKEGYLVAAVERSPETDIDASVVEAFGFDILRDFDSDVAKATLQHFELLRLPSGGFMRSVGESTYQTNEWAYVDYRMASAFLRAGQNEKANQLIDLLTARSTQNFYLLPELYVATASEGPIGSYQGSNPMVGYGAGVMMMAILDRERRLENRRCD